MMNRSKHFTIRILLSLAVVGAIALPARGDVVLPQIIGDNMVLQQGKPVPIWGWAAPGEKVTVQFDGAHKMATASAAGFWVVRLPPMKASTVPAEMIVVGRNQLVLRNVLVGEVWLCAGQSNMEKPIGEQPGQKPVINFRQELQSGDRYPTLRLFKVQKAMSSEPARDVKGNWNVCNSNTLERTKFSAVGYFFARDLQDEIHVPIGMIEASWGGTRIEPWTPAEGFYAVSGLQAMAGTVPDPGKLSNRAPSVLYNGMIAPVRPYAIRGALWYQGESNCIDRPDGPTYTDKMEALIVGWRDVWGQGAFPFYYVQLAPYHYYAEREKPRVPTPTALPEMWEAQTRALRVRNTGMAVITDLVSDLKDIHPTRKAEVGQRLARVALAQDYGHKEISWSGPMFKSMKVRGNKAIISFDHVDGGLVSANGRPLDWFTVSGDDGKYFAADAVIDGDKVVVTCPDVSHPRAVRFAWDEAAQPNLFNKAGLPAGPFRTD